MTEPFHANAKLLDELANTAGAMRAVLRRGLLSPTTPKEALSLRGSPVLHIELCTECQACVEACPTACIVIRAAGGLPQLDLDWQRCMCCGICAQICPEDAISLSTEAQIVTPGLPAHKEQRA